VPETTTGRIRRNSVPAVSGVHDDFADSKFRHGNIQPAAPPPTTRPWWFGDLGAAGVEDIAAVADRVWPASPATALKRRRSLRHLLDHLAALPGQTWQQRWDGSPFADGARPVTELDTGGQAVASLGLRVLLCLRVIRPTLPAMRGNRLTGYADLFHQAQADESLDTYFAAVRQRPVLRSMHMAATFDVACALTIYGIPLAELTPQALLHYAWECRRHGLTYKNRGSRDTFGGLLAWQVLHDIGHFPPGTPQSIRAAGQAGRRSVEQLVDQHTIANPAVRDLLVEYLRRREPGVDYSTLRSLATRLAGTFWAKIEEISPGQKDLRIPRHIYDQWKAEISIRPDGQPRINVDPVLLAVRSLYLDLHTWSVGEPERWAQWVAPSPVEAADLVGSGRRQQRARERSADRTRLRQPLLPSLVAHVQDRYQHQRQLLAAARDSEPDALIAVDGHTYQRVWTREDQRLLASDGHRRVRVRDQATGEILSVIREEDTAFWEWAVVEVLRHTGVRIEELLELTQLSIRQYRRPNGETIGLLVIAPSKTDRERVIPMTADLLSVIAAIIRRHTVDGAPIARISRYDPHDKVHSPPMPFLFQRQLGTTRTVLSHGVVCAMLQRRCADLANTDPQFAGVTFAPHDFRRLFATELVNSGLPIHIGAALLGHLNLETTRGYVAVFEEDLIRHYQGFLERRRQVRPAEEYRPASDTEWAEFEAHFDKRKVELGNCGRPYGTPCIHEHSCLRCSMLHVNPAMLPRLDTIEDDLMQRRDRASQEGWLGEIEGIDVTLARLRRKRDQTLRLSKTAAPVHLGIPTTRSKSGHEHT
jgi:site-specific recombinase XerD